MKSMSDLHTIRPYPRIRQLMVDGGKMGLQKHTVHGLVEFDITKAREAIRQHRSQTGQALSFSAFFLVCLGKAIELDKQMHAYRNWRNQLILFDDVDVNMLFEVEVDGKKMIRPHIIRGVNKKSILEIHEEIRAFQNGHESSPESKFIDWFVRLPGIIRRLLLTGSIQESTVDQRLLRHSAGNLHWHVWERWWLGHSGAQPFTATHPGGYWRKTGGGRSPG